MTKMTKDYINRISEPIVLKWIDEIIAAESFVEFSKSIEKDIGKKIKKMRRTAERYLEKLKRRKEEIPEYLQAGFNWVIRIRDTMQRLEEIKNKKFIY